MIVQLPRKNCCPILCSPIYPLSPVFGSDVRSNAYLAPTYLKSHSKARFPCFLVISIHSVFIRLLRGLRIGVERSGASSYRCKFDCTRLSKPYQFTLTGLGYTWPLLIGYPTPSLAWTSHITPTPHKRFRKSQNADWNDHWVGNQLQGLFTKALLPPRERLTSEN